jgi:phosphoribosylformimino-5-aminoimidazole carboxamide ribotide isomerase
MQIFPAIDLKGGQCVRLTQGDFDTAKIYQSDPMLQMEQFVQAGARWLHVVDLDGARAGAVQQLDLLVKMAQANQLKLQVGGGIRDEAVIEQLLIAGVQRVVVGSLAVQDPPRVQRWLQQFGASRLVLAFDVRMVDDQPEILTHGWQNSSQQSLWALLDGYRDSGLQTILCTDVAKDGMLAGTNRQLYQAIQQHWPELDVLASGGVSDQADVLALAALGLAGVVVGKAIYENRLDLAATIVALGQASDVG